MENVGVYEAKTHFAALVERASAGEEIVITRHGRPVARLVPMEDPHQRPISEIVDSMRKHPIRLEAGEKSAELIQRWISEGRM